jgi:hypothetical protein
MRPEGEEQSPAARPSTPVIWSPTEESGLEVLAYGWWTFGGGIQADQRLEG